VNGQQMRTVTDVFFKRGDEINDVRRKMDELKAKADDAERRWVTVRRTFTDWIG
jgi:hypothetical protein